MAITPLTDTGRGVFRLKRPKGFDIGLTNKLRRPLRRRPLALSALVMKLGRPRQTFPLCRVALPRKTSSRRRPSLTLSRSQPPRLIKPPTWMALRPTPMAGASLALKRRPACTCSIYALAPLSKRG